MPETEPKTFADAELMNARTLGAITTASHPHLQRELEAATQDIREFCRWHIFPRKQVTHRRVGAFAESVWLTAMQIATIDEVTIDGRVFDAAAITAIEFDPDTGWTNLCGRNVLIKFTAGFEVIPANLETITLELSAAGLGTSLGFEREQAGAVSVTFGRAGGGIDEDTPQGQRLIAYRIGRLP